MKELLKVLMAVFGAFSVLLFVVWAVTSSGSAEGWEWTGNPNWATVALGLCLGALLILLLVYMLPGERGLPLGHLKPGAYPKSRVIGEVKKKDPKKGWLLLLLHTESPVPIYTVLPKSDFLPGLDPEGNVLKVEVKTGHDTRGRKIKYRVLSFGKF